MHNLIPISVDEGINFYIPDTWVKEVGEQGEYAFISSDGGVFMTAIFIGLDQSDTTPLQQILEEATAGVTEVADFASSLIQTDHYAARHIIMEGQHMFFAITDGMAQNLRVVANLFFKAQDGDLFEKNRPLLEQMIEAVEINE